MGTSEDSLLFLADMRIDELQSENVRLQDENARLRSCLSDDAENARMIMAENEKLRELAWDLVSYGEDAECGIAAAFETRLREVGIEVQP